MKYKLLIVLLLVVPFFVGGQYEKVKCPEGGVFVVLTVNGVVQQSGCAPDTTGINIPFQPEWQRVFVHIETD